MLIFLEITDATQYATAYEGDKPVATLQRRHVMGKGPYWKAYNTKGELLFSTYTNASVKYLAKRLVRELSKQSAAE